MAINGELTINEEDSPPFISVQSLVCFGLEWSTNTNRPIGLLSNELSKT